jgi:hypothetical protein
MRILSLIFLSLLGSLALSEENPIVGDWALTLPNQEAGWLSVARDQAGKLQAALLWAVGNSRPVEAFELIDDKLVFSKSLRRPLAPKEEVAVDYRMSMQAMKDELRCEMQADGTAPIAFFGKRQPPLPPRPDLSKIAFGESIELFNGRNLDGWRITNPAKKNGWSVRDGLLCNDTPKTDFGAYGEYANLRTDREFEDFRLQLEYRLPSETG